MGNDVGGFDALTFSYYACDCPRGDVIAHMYRAEDELRNLHGSNPHRLLVSQQMRRELVEPSERTC